MQIVNFNRPIVSIPFTHGAGRRSPLLLEEKLKNAARSASFLLSEPIANCFRRRLHHSEILQLACYVLV